MSTLTPPPSATAPANFKPTTEAEPMPPVVPKKKEPFRPNVYLTNLSTLPGEQLQGEYVQTQMKQLQDSSPIEGDISLKTDGVGQTAIMKYLEEDPGLKQDLISAATEKLKLKPGDKYYEGALLDQLTRDAFRPVVDSMRIQNIRKVGKEVLDEVEKYVKYMKLKGKLEKTILGQHTYSFDARKNTLAMSSYSSFAQGWQSAEGREKLMEKAAEDGQESLREFITAKLTDEQFAILPRQEQIEFLDSAMDRSQSRMQKFGEALLDRGDAVGGVVLMISGRGWTEKADSQIHTLVKDQRVIKGLYGKYNEGGDIILTDGTGGKLPKFVKMKREKVGESILSKRNFIIDTGTSDLSVDGIFADYKKGPDYVLGQMVGINSLSLPPDAA